MLRRRRLVGAARSGAVLLVVVLLVLVELLMVRGRGRGRLHDRARERAARTELTHGGGGGVEHSAMLGEQSVRVEHLVSGGGVGGELGAHLPRGRSRRQGGGGVVAATEGEGAEEEAEVVVVRWWCCCCRCWWRGGGGDGGGGTGGGKLGVQTRRRCVRHATRLRGSRHGAAPYAPAPVHTRPSPANKQGGGACVLCSERGSREGRLLRGPGRAHFFSRGPGRALTCEQRLASSDACARCAAVADLQQQQQHTNSAQWIVSGITVLRRSHEREGS
jgi:hypothetical protein